MSQQYTAEQREAVLARTEGYPLILVSPRHRQRNALLAMLLAAERDTLYFAVAEADSALRPMLKAMVDAVQDVDPKFGKQLAQALGGRTSATELADALAADLGKARPKPRLVVLDNLDNLERSTDAKRFFEHLVRSLPRGMQLVVSGRYLDYMAWFPLVSAGLAYPLGEEQTLDGGILDPNKPESPHLEVYALSGGNVFVNGLPLTTWDGPLPRNLFYFFVDHPMVTRDEIFETFWPDLPTKEATNVFHVTKRKISERLGYELTAYAGGFYRPSGQLNVHYDVARFETVVEDSKLLPPTDPAEWHRAIRLYRSPFLNRIEMPWIIRRREALRLSYAEALIGLGRLYRSLNEKEHAISFFLRALREVPQREDIHRDLMTLYHERGETDKAIGQYRLLATTLERTLGITPSRPTVVLYKELVGQQTE
ncbi:MAG: bacterial transcriptional activator domain-containing protein [Anaerolineae bacterium]|nr:bacterial transcriptional activator domain-containing protein [Anaerolineae bacterium]